MKRIALCHDDRGASSTAASHSDVLRINRPRELSAESHFLDARRITPVRASRHRGNGPGIPPERAPNVFERFYRARGDEQTSGHGPGLSIARELARAHGGDLTLTKAQSDWTEFCLRLSPSSIHLQTQKPAPATQEERGAFATAESAYPFTRRRKKRPADRAGLSHRD